MSSKVSFLLLLAIPLLPHVATGFQAPVVVPNTLERSITQLLSSSSDDSDRKEVPSRRSFLASAGIAIAGMGVLPQYASAGIDVSGLRTDGGGSGNPDMASQLKAYDGSGSARVREIKSIKEASSSAPISSISSKSAASVDDKTPIATWAYRYNPGVGASLARAGALGNLYQYNSNLVAPSGSKRRSIGVQFEFPSDWLQLDRQIGGIQYVDQRNGDKLYVFRAPLPEETSLATVPKSVIGDLIFDPNGSFVKTGQTIEDYKVSSAQILTECPNGMCATRRRFKIKFATLTGNGLRVERRALVDTYQVDNDIYMLMTSSNAVNFERKEGRERETVENIVASFQIEA
jgi:hypothetical protein